MLCEYGIATGRGYHVETYIECKQCTAKSQSSISPAFTSDAAARRAGRQIDRVCTEIGFFIITGHGMPPDVVCGLIRKAHEFFALPTEEKPKVMPVDMGTPCGFKPVG